MGNAGGNALHREIDRLFQQGTVAGLTDSQLLDRYLTRSDDDAFEALVRLHGPMVLGLCRRMLRDRQDVEDAFQATFLVLVRKGPTLRDRTLLANWLYGVAYRVAVRARRKSARRDSGRQPSERLDEVADKTAHPPEVADWIPILDQELTRLPDKYRGPLVLCYLNGMTHEQSAGQLGIPVGTVRSRLARGRDLLKRRLERRGVAPSLVGVAVGPTSKTFLSSVPAPLVRSTLAFVTQCSTLPWIGAGLGTGAATVSAFSLAQGVITSMILNPVKLVAIGLLSAGVIGVGVVQGVRAFDARPGDPAASGELQKKAVGIAVHPPLPKDVAKRLIKASEKLPDPPADDRGEFSDMDPSIPVEARVLELKKQLDQLSAQVQSKPQPKAEERSRRTNAMLDLTGFKSQLGMSLPELEAEIQILKRRLKADREFIEFQKGLHRATPDGRPSEILAATRQYNETRDSIQRIIAKLNRVKLDLADERASLEYEQSRKRAEQRVEHANVEVASTKVARNDRLNTRIQGAVSPEDLDKDESELRFANAQEDVVKADVAYLEMRLNNLDFPLKKVDELLAEAKAIDLSSNEVPAEKPAQPTAR